jgi:L-ascorbate metabolism protein UlaG (beta-lactamase superfamily)
MRVEWFGQSAFRLDAGETTVVIDPFANVERLPVSYFETSELSPREGPLVVVPAAP